MRRRGRGVRAARYELDNLNRDFNKVNKEVAKKKIVRASLDSNPTRVLVSGSGFPLKLAHLQRWYAQGSITQGGGR